MGRTKIMRSIMTIQVQPSLFPQAQHTREPHSPTRYNRETPLLWMGRIKQLVILLINTTKQYVVYMTCCDC